MNDVHSLAGEYAVGSLTGDEAQQFETHLATCTDCREEVSDMREIAVQLSEAVAASPPPSLRSSLLAQIAHTAQDRPTHDGEQATPETVPAASTAAPGESSNVLPLQRRSRGSWAAGLLAAATVLAAIAMGGWAIHNRNDARDATAQAQQLTRLLTAKDVRTVSGNFAHSGLGAVVVSSSQGLALLVGADLPALPAGQAYEVWAITGSGVAPAGTFKPDGPRTVVSLPRAAVDATTVGVTVEPEGGSPQPTTAMVFRVNTHKA